MKSIEKQKENADNQRFIVKAQVKFGMLFGYYIYDTKENKSLGYEFDEDEKYLADAKAEFKNELYK